MTHWISNFSYYGPKNLPIRYDHICSIRPQTATHSRPSITHNPLSYQLTFHLAERQNDEQTVHSKHVVTFENGHAFRSRCCILIICSKKIWIHWCRGKKLLQIYLCPGQRWKQTHQATCIPSWEWVGVESGEEEGIEVWTSYWLELIGTCSVGLLHLKYLLNNDSALSHTISFLLSFFFVSPC